MGFEDEMYDDEPRTSQRREETLYVSEEYKIFMIAGTPCGFTHDTNQISVRPFRAMPPDTIEAMREIAKPWAEETQKESRIKIRVNEPNLDLIDGYSNVTSKFPISELDDDVRERILYKIRWRIFDGGDRHKEIDPWTKYFEKAADVQVPSPPVSTGNEVPVQKPLTFKKPGGLKL